MIKRNWIRNFLTIIVILLIFFFLIRSILANWGEVPFAQLKISLDFLFISILFLLSSSFAGSFAWCKNLAALGQKIAYFKGLKTVAIAQFGKYIPGKVWSVGGRVLLSKKYGVREIESTLAILIETLTLFLSATVLFLISLGFYGKVTIPSKVYLSFIFIPLSLIFLHPKILRRLLSFGMRLRQFSRGSAEVKIPTANLLIVYLLYFTSWLIHSTGFFFLTRAIYPVGYDKFLGIIGAFSLAWALSFAILFIPGGFGIREGILTFFLRFFIPLPIAALVSIIGRLWTTLGEVLMFLVALIVRDNNTRRNNEEEKTREDC